MAYQPIQYTTSQPRATRDDEVDTLGDFGNAENLQASTQSLKEDNEHSEPFMRSTSRPKGSKGDGWPLEPRHTAMMTPWRVCLIAFDTVLASTPIMFIGESFSFALNKVQ